MSGPKRNPDKLNTIGVVVVGVCGAVLVYVTIVALEAFYVSDTSEIQTMRDYGGQDTQAMTLKADQLKNLSDRGEANGVAPGTQQTYRIPIDTAMKLVARDAKADPSKVTGGAMPRGDRQTVPVPGGKAPAGAGSAAAPPPAGGGSAAPATPVPTGAGSGVAPGAGSAAATPPNAGSAAGSGGHAP
jgi:hypothetical protein